MTDAERGPALPAREAYADVPGARIWYAVLDFLRKHEPPRCRP